MSQYEGAWKRRALKAGCAVVTFWLVGMAVCYVFTHKSRSASAAPPNPTTPIVDEIDEER